MMKTGGFTSYLFLLTCLWVSVSSAEEGCLYNFTQSRGHVTIPETNDVIEFYNISSCTWVVTGPVDSVIQFDLQTVDLGGNSSRLVLGVGGEPGNSSTEYATVRPFARGRHRQVVVPHSTAWLRVRGAADSANLTVVFSYTVIPRVECDSPVQQTALHGYLVTMNYPAEYPINGECTWKFDLPEGHMIQLTFNDFDLQDDSDFLLIGEGTEVLQGVFTPYTGRLETSPYVVSFGYSRVWLLFVSNHLRDDGGHTGFNISYVIKPKGESENEIPAIQTIAIPKPLDQPWVEKIQLTISGLSQDTMQGEVDLFKATVAGFVTAYCKHAKSACGTQAKQLSAEDVQISQVREDGRSVDVELTLGPDFPANMAAISSLNDLGEADTMSREAEPIIPVQSDGPSEAIPLPKWLIGVIAVVAFLVVVFFVLIVYSLLKDRKKPEKGQEDGRSDSPSDEREAAKDTSSKRKTKNTSQDPANIETVTEIGTVSAVPNGTSQSKVKDKRVDDVKPSNAERSVDDPPKRADPEGKSDVHIIEPLQSSAATKAADADPTATASESNTDEPTTSDGKADEDPSTKESQSETKTENNEDSATTDSADDAPTPEHDLSTDL